MTRQTSRLPTISSNEICARKFMSVPLGPFLMVAQDVCSCTTVPNIWIAAKAGLNVTAPGYWRGIPVRPLAKLRQGASPGGLTRAMPRIGMLATVGGGVAPVTFPAALAAMSEGI